MSVFIKCLFNFSIVIWLNRRRFDISFGGGGYISFLNDFSFFAIKQMNCALEDVVYSKCIWLFKSLLPAVVQYKLKF